MTRAPIVLVGLALTALACAPGGPTSGAGPGSPEAGKQLVTSKGCIACHTIQQIPEARGTVGPVLDGVGDPNDRPKIAGGTLDNTPENLRRWLSDPPAAKPGTVMPNLGLTRQEIGHLVAFLQTLK